MGNKLLSAWEKQRGRGKREKRGRERSRGIPEFFLSLPRSLSGRAPRSETNWQSRSLGGYEEGREEESRVEAISSHSPVSILHRAT